MDNSEGSEGNTRSACYLIVCHYMFYVVNISIYFYPCAGEDVLDRDVR